MDPKFFATPADFRAWLAKHHASADELLVGFWKKDSGKPSIDWPQARDQALCFGWIDGVRKSLGPDSYTIRFTPRRPGSVWSKVNVERYAALKAEGAMTAAGEAAFEAGKEDRSHYSYESEARELAPDETEQFRANAQGVGGLGEAPAGLPQDRAALGDQREEARNPRPTPRHADRGQRAWPQDRARRYRATRKPD